MRITIERLRTLVLLAGVLLLAALVVFLARGKLKSRFNPAEIPHRLGLNITSDASGFTLDHAFGGHSRYRIHASKASQYKNNHAILKDVQIELYGEDGSRVDRIEGAEFDYDKQSGKAQAAGPVEITLMRPGVAPAIAPKATAAKVEKGKATPLAAVAATAERGEIHVKTSGLVFDTASGVATTAQHADFTMVQGSGSSLGASYDSKLGLLVLDRAVELNTERNGDTVVIRAQHAEFARDTHLGRLHEATAGYRGAEASAGDADILFRDDGSAVRLDARNGFNLLTANGAHLAAPTGQMEFDQHNQPRHGRLEGGVQMDSTRAAQNGGSMRQVHASSPTAELDFTARGELRHAHLERGVEMASEQVSEAALGPLKVRRTWKSPVADVEFRDNGKGQAEPATIHGVEGVVVTGESQRGASPAEPSRLSADEVTGEFGPNSVLKAMTGVGHASLQQSNAAGTRQTAEGDRIRAQFAQNGPSGKSAQNGGKSDLGGTGQIQSAVIDGHVLLTRQAAANPTLQGGSQTPAPLQAWAGRAQYESAGEWMHLTLNPRVEDGGIAITADKVDVSRQSGDAFAHGNVKATWLGSASGKAGPPGSSANGVSSQPTGPLGGPALGGDGPAHAVAEEAELHQATGEITFKGHARLWQQANSVAGPVIVLDRQRRTLVARSTDPAEPVKAVLLSQAGLAPGAARDSSQDAPGKEKTPSVVRVSGGDLKYSDSERKAVVRAGALRQVAAETATATSSSDEVDLQLLPAGNHAGKDGAAAQVDRMTAHGHVVVLSAGRRGTGEQLVYTGENGDYVLTGTAAVLPRMTDPARGSVSGQALIFHSRDDSVSIEGKTRTETTAPK